MEALGIDIKLLIAQAVNFLLFFFIFKRFLYGPFLRYLNKEQENEKEKQRLLKDLQEKETSLERRQKEVLADASTQALKILKNAEDLAVKKKKEIIDKAHEEITEMKLKAKNDLEDEKGKLLDDVRMHVIETSKSMTETVLKDFIDEKNQRGLLENIFKNIKKSKVYEN